MEVRGEGGVSADPASVIGGRLSRSHFITFLGYLVSTGDTTRGPGDPV